MDRGKKGEELEVKGEKKFGSSEQKSGAIKIGEKEEMGRDDETTTESWEGEVKG